MESGPPGSGTGCDDGKLDRSSIYAFLSLAMILSVLERVAHNAQFSELPDVAGGPHVVLPVVSIAASTSSRGTGPTQPCAGT